MSKIRRLCLVLGDQLSFDLASLQGRDHEHDMVPLVEVTEEASHVPHHPQNRTDVQRDAPFCRGVEAARYPRAVRHPQ